jgi:hypothetical protein
VVSELDAVRHEERMSKKRKLMTSICYCLGRPTRGGGGGRQADKLNGLQREERW